MSLRPVLGPVYNTLRALYGPDQLDTRNCRIVVRTRTWDGGKVQVGSATVSDTEILPQPKVIERGRDLEVRSITPAYPSSPTNPAGGYTYDQLFPPKGGAVEAYYVAIGQDGSQRAFDCIDIDTSKAFNWVLKLRSLDRKVPF